MIQHILTIFAWRHDPWVQYIFWVYLKDDFIVMLSVKGADGSIVVVSNSSNVFGAVQEVDGDTRGEGEDPRGADGDCCVQLRAEGNAFHWVHNSLQKINYECKKICMGIQGGGGHRGHIELKQRINRNCPAV